MIEILLFVIFLGRYSQYLQWGRQPIISSTHPQWHGIVLLTEKGKFFTGSCLMQGFSNFFVSRPFPNIFKISATLKWYKLQQTYSNKVIQVDFGDPREAFGDPKKWSRPPVWEPLLNVIAVNVISCLLWLNCMGPVGKSTVDNYITDQLLLSFC